MSALLNATPKGTSGVTAADATSAPHHFANGLPYDSNSALAVDTVSAIDHYHQGLPFTANGRLATAGAAAATYGSGAAPFSSAGRLCTGSTPASYASGVPYNSSGRVAVATGAVVAPTVDAGGPYDASILVPKAIDGTVVPGTYAVTTLWTADRPGTFADATAVDTTFTATQGGDYVLTLTATPSVGVPVSDPADFFSNS